MAEPRESQPVFRGRVVRLDIEDWEGHPPYEVVHHPGAAAVLPITPDDHVLLVKQFRPAVRQALIEIPAGLLDVEGEDALTCASRELFEETGFRHRTIEFLGRLLFLGGLLRRVRSPVLGADDAEPEAAAEQGIEVSRVPFGRMVAAARAGRVRDAKTALALLLAAGRPPLP